MIDPEFELWLAETWQRDTRAQPPDPLETFFERIEVEKALDHMHPSERFSDPPALNAFREFVKAEKERIPQMTAKQIRSSAAQVLRKAADALVAI